MGKTNLAVNRLLQRKSIYADLMNGTIFNGQQNLTEDDLEWIPIITIVLYTGNKESWDGPRSLMQMFKLSDDEKILFRDFLPDYKIHLVNVYDINNPELFQTA